MTRKREKMNSNYVGVAPLGDPHKTINKSNANIVGVDDPVCYHFEEPTKKSSNNYSNLISNFQPITSDHNGITLIALIITIIVMIILVGVSVNVAINEGLFKTAKHAVNKTNESKEQEQIELAVASAVSVSDLSINTKTLRKNLSSLIKEQPEEVILDGKNLWVVTGSLTGKKYTIENTGTVTPNPTLSSQVKIGDYVNYNPKVSTYTAKGDLTGVTDAINSEDKQGSYGYYSIHIDYNDYENMDSLGNQTFTTDSLKWRVLDVTDNKVTLIADNPISQNLTLYAGKGYLNGPKIMNELCNTLYGNGNGSSKARALSIEDIDKIVGVPDRISYEDLNPNYGKSYIVESSYGSQYMPDGSIAKGKTITNTTYYYDIKKYIDTTSAMYEILNKPQKCWLASTLTYTYCPDPDVLRNFHFHIRNLESGKLSSDQIIHSDRWVKCFSQPVIPVVELNDKIITTGQNGDGIWQLDVS